MIKVCDMMMGCGKTSAAISWMNDNPNEKFLFITPYTKETERIKQNCPALNFRLPENTIKEFGFNKREHLKELLSKGANIAMTHVLMSLADEETLELISHQGYTAIIDEAITVMSKIKENQTDIRVAMKSEYFRCEDGEDGEARPIEVTDDTYDGIWMKDIHLYAKSHRLVALKDQDGDDRLYCWMFNGDILSAPKNVIILTYLFKASSMYYMLQMAGLPYQTIGVVQTETGKYMFSDTEATAPAYCLGLKDKITVVDNPRMNAIGNRYHALSMNWQKRAAVDPSNGNAERLRKNLSNFFNNVCRGASYKERLWTCADPLKNTLAGKGYSKNFLVFNQRATNDYHNAKILAYCMNVFIPTWEQKYYEQRGVVTSPDDYALSTMIQWIWRSNIRDGGSVIVYVPSRRMRELLLKWIDNVSNGIVAGQPVGELVMPPKAITPEEYQDYNKETKGA